MLKIENIQGLDLGIQGENRARAIEIDCGLWRDMFPNGQISITHQRPGDTAPDVTSATYDDETGILRWEPTNYDTFYQGRGAAEIRMTENRTAQANGETLTVVYVKKSITIETVIHPAIVNPHGETIESNQQAYINEVARLQQLAAGAAEDAVNFMNSAVFNQETAKAWATGIRDGEPVGQDDETYQNNAKYYAESISGDAAAAAASAAAAAGSQTAAAQSATAAATSATEAAASETNAASAEGTAISARNAAEAARARAQMAEDGTSQIQYTVVTKVSNGQTISRYEVLEPEAFYWTRGDGQRVYNAGKGAKIYAQLAKQEAAIAHADASSANQAKVDALAAKVAASLDRQQCDSDASSARSSKNAAAASETAAAASETAAAASAAAALAQANWVRSNIFTITLEAPIPFFSGEGEVIINSDRITADTIVVNDVHAGNADIRWVSSAGTLTLTSDMSVLQEDLTLVLCTPNADMEAEILIMEPVEDGGDDGDDEVVPGIEPGA